VVETTVSTTSQVGARSERAIANALLDCGFAVFLPFFGGHERTDLVYLDRSGLARRVQCKTGRFTDGFVSFWTCSNTGGRRETYVGQVDDFGVYSSELEAVFLVPAADLPSRQARLRLSATKSSQAIGIRWAEPYRITPPRTDPSDAGTATDE
jgi:hypothetical protein